MKVRIGIGTGTTSAPEDLARLGQDLVELGFDSLWLPEVLTAGTVDPLVGLAWVGGGQPALKLGTTMVLPGRNLVRLAKAVASLDLLSNGNFLVTMVPGLAQGAERGAIGVAPAQRGTFMDQAMALLRQLWAGETVTYHGPLGELDQVTLSPRPLQDPFDVWSGGQAPAALERCGRLFDGWLPAFCTPEEVAQGRRGVEQAAANAGRSISEEHYGVSLAYRYGDPEGPGAQLLRTRLRGRSLDQIVPRGLDGLRVQLEKFIAVGFSKFVVRPLAEPTSWRQELEDLAAAVGHLQS